jgi:hypothetical protein
MTFDLAGYRDKYKDFYGDAPLEDIAKDAYSRGYHQGEPDYDTWKKSSGVDQHIQRENETREPSFADKIRKAAA